MYVYVLPATHERAQHAEHSACCVPCIRWECRLLKLVYACHRCERIICSAVRKPERERHARRNMLGLRPASHQQQRTMFGPHIRVRISMLSSSCKRCWHKILHDTPHSSSRSSACTCNSTLRIYCYMQCSAMLCTGRMQLHISL